MKSVSQVSSLRSQVSRALWGCSQMYICHCLCLCLCICHCICLCHCIFVGQVIAAHHSDQMYQRSQVSRTALWGCSLNVFVFVMFFVFVFVFVIFLVMSCLLITLNKCLKGHKSLELLSKCLCLCLCHCHCHCHCLCLCICLCQFCWSGHGCSSLGSNVSKVTSL